MKKNLQRSSSILCLMLTLILMAFTNSNTRVVVNSNEATGKQLFMLNCATCHHPTRDLTGPSFYGVRQRWKNEKTLYQFIKNSTEVIKKDGYAKNLFIKWNKTVMTAFPKLTDAEITSILNYVDEEAKKKGLLK